MVSNINFLWFLLFLMCYSLNVAVNTCINCSLVQLFKITDGSVFLKPNQLLVLHTILSDTNVVTCAYDICRSLTHVTYMSASSAAPSSALACQSLSSMPSIHLCSESLVSTSTTQPHHHSSRTITSSPSPHHSTSSHHQQQQQNHHVITITSSLNVFSASSTDDRKGKTFL